MRSCTVKKTLWSCLVCFCSETCCELTQISLFCSPHCFCPWVELDYDWFPCYGKHSTLPTSVVLTVFKMIQIQLVALYCIFRATFAFGKAEMNSLLICFVRCGLRTEVYWPQLWTLRTVAQFALGSDSCDHNLIDSSFNILCHWCLSMFLVFHDSSSDLN